MRRQIYRLEITQGITMVTSGLSHNPDDEDYHSKKDVLTTTRERP